MALRALGAFMRALRALEPSYSFLPLETPTTGHGYSKGPKALQGPRGVGEAIRPFKALEGLERL